MEDNLPKEKICRRCHSLLPLDCFRYKRTGRFQKTARCRACLKEVYDLNKHKYQAQSREACRRPDYVLKRAAYNRLPEQMRKSRERAKKQLKALREQVKVIYGERCVCCGEARKEFLTIDHVRGKQPGEGRNTNSLLRRLVAAGTPLPDFRLLCFNCNMALGFHGYCPHATGVLPTREDKLKRDAGGTCSLLGSPGIAKFLGGTNRLIWERKDRLQKRQKVIELYGGKCICCGNAIYEFLVLDHTTGREVGERNKYTISKLLKALPTLLDGFRILCHNCNESVACFGFCPHNPETINFKIDGRIVPQRCNWRKSLRPEAIFG